MTIKADKTRNFVAKYARRFNKACGITSKKEKLRRGTEKNIQQKIENEIENYYKQKGDYDG